MSCARNDVPAVARSAIPHAPSPIPRSQHGFTLIEVLLATVLLALGLSIAFASLHTAAGSVQRAQAAAERNEHLRAVQGVLYRVLHAAQPMVLERQGDGQLVAWFEGQPDSMRFVAPMPGYMSRGGPYVVSLRLVPGSDGTRLQFGYAMLVDEKPLASDLQRPPEELLDGIAQAHFEYRGLGPDAAIGPWSSVWDRPAQLPMQVRIVLRFKDGALPWPSFAVALPLGLAQARPDDGMRMHAGVAP